MINMYKDSLRVTLKNNIKIKHLKQNRIITCSMNLLDFFFFGDHRGIHLLVLQLLLVAQILFDGQHFQRPKKQFKLYNISR